MSVPKRVFVSRLVDLPVFDPLGDQVGVIRDVVCVFRPGKTPRVSGFLVEIAKKQRVFMPTTRLTSVMEDQAICSGVVNTREFQKRKAETLLVGEIFGQVVSLVSSAKQATVEDLGLSVSSQKKWEVTRVFVRHGVAGKGLTSRWRQRMNDTEVLHLADVEGLGPRLAGVSSAAELVASFEHMKPADVAAQLRGLPEWRLPEVAAELPDDQLADVLEELSEDDQVLILGKLKQDRAADVLEEMQPDDAADLLSELPEGQQENLLSLMEPDEAREVRHLMAFDEFTAGGLMTTGPVILSPKDTVAEAIAKLRQRELHPTLAAAAFVCRSPREIPTGKFLGVVHIQRMLREPPYVKVASITDTDATPLRPEAPLSAVTRTMAHYDLVSVPVTNAEGQLLGVVTVDDVLDHLLPEDWREGADQPSDPVTGQMSLRDDAAGGGGK